VAPSIANTNIKVKEAPRSIFSIFVVPSGSSQPAMLLFFIMLRQTVTVKVTMQANERAAKKIVIFLAV